MKGHPVRSGTARVLSAALIGLGVIAIARTLVLGGGALTVGVVVGLVLIVAGVARLWLDRRMP